MPVAKSTEWRTPFSLWVELHREFDFDLDAAATKENALCDFYFTKEDNALVQDWFGRVYCNPPYGRGLDQWVAKAHEEINKNGVFHKIKPELIVMLLPARTSTYWFHEFIYKKAEVRFLKGRLRFEGAANSAPFPSMIVIWRRKQEGEDA